MAELTAEEKAEKAARLFELERDIQNRKEQLQANIKEYDKLLAEVRSFIPAIKPGPKPKLEMKAQRKPNVNKGRSKPAKPYVLVDGVAKGNGPVIGAEIPGTEFDLKG